MYSTTLKHKGYTLKISFRTTQYYARTEFENGKTLYQILFEHLIDGRAVSLKGLVRKYESKNPDITTRAIAYMVEKIEDSVKGSPNKRLRGKKFKKLTRGGANPVLSRQNINSRLAPGQREILEQVIKSMSKRKKAPPYKQIRAAALRRLEAAGLAKNLALSDLTILRAKKRLGLPIMKPGFVKTRRRKP